MDLYKDSGNPVRSILFRFSIVLMSFFFFGDDLKAQIVVDTFNLPAGYTFGQLRDKNTLNVDPSNNVWIGFDTIGAGKFDGANWTVYDTTNGLPSMNVLCFAFSGNITWMGTDKGLVKYNGSSFTVYDSINSALTANYILSLFAVGNIIWIGTRDGAFNFDGTTWIHYSTSNSGLASDTVNCFTKSGNDTVWIGTANGLSKFFNGSWKIYNMGVWGQIRKIVADASGNIWIEPYGPPYTNLRILYQDSISRLSRFFSFCYPIVQGRLLGTHFGNIVLSNRILEINLNPVNAWEALGSAPAYSLADLDSSGRIWSVSLGFGQKLFSIDYHNSLQPVVQASDCYTLDINHVQARIWNNGSMFWDLFGNAQYEVPKGSGLNSIFADGFWIGGMDAANQLHVAAQTYRQSGNDFWPGPLDTTNATINAATVAQYDSIWKIDRYTIDVFITQFALGNVTNGSYSIPDIILHWPAQGSGNISRNLAPFVDHNHDGNYNPYDGDYPAIKGDQMLWCVFNDNYQVHTESDGATLGLEIHLSAYAYNCPLVADSESVINYTTFYHYRIFNRSDTSYSQVYMGRMTDADLGNYLDDYAGCDTTLNIGFVYNGDNLDEGIAGYGLNPPIQNLLFLSDQMTQFRQYNGSPSPVIGNPVTALNYYDYMKGLWRNGSQMTYGGNGAGGGPGATTIPTNFMFPGNPYDTSSGVWNEISTGYAPDDRRLLTSTGPFSFPAHSEKEFDFAYVWTRDASNPNGLTTSWAKNVHDVLKVKQWFMTDSFPCNNTSIGIHETENAPVAFTVYPNPAAQNLTLFISSKNNLFYRMEILDITGRKIRNGIVFPNRNNSISIEGISPGIYFVRVHDKETFAVKKFIKQ